MDKNYFRTITGLIITDIIQVIAIVAVIFLIILSPKVLAAVSVVNDSVANSADVNSPDVNSPDVNSPDVNSHGVNSPIENNSFANNYSASALIIDDIVCRENENTKCSFIKKKYYQGIGEHVNPDEIADARLRLGTLQQFINVRIVLEKSKQRGHVIVVFIVEEASHVQYGLQLAYHGSQFYFSTTSYEERSHTGYLTASVTDFNFLGSGKQLGVSLRSEVQNMESYRPYSDFERVDRDLASNQINVAYYDPHLLGSVKYYLSADIGYVDNELSYYSFNNYKKTNAGVRKQSHIGKYFNLSAGKRFASYSYLSLNYHVLKDNGLFQGDKKTFEDVSLNYGWDSRDDLIFPTYGSRFQIDARALNNSNYKAIILNYEDNVAINDFMIFNYSVGDAYAYWLDDKKFSDPNPYAAFALSDIDMANSQKGQYTGWKYQIQMPLKDIRTESIGASVEYIRQTNKLILHFTVGYQMDWGDLL